VRAVGIFVVWIDCCVGYVVKTLKYAMIPSTLDEFVC
jgi:hypothetical protein